MSGADADARAGAAYDINALLLRRPNSTPNPVSALSINIPDPGSGTAGAVVDTRKALVSVGHGEDEQNHASVGMLVPGT